MNVYRCLRGVRFSLAVLALVLPAASGTQVQADEATLIQRVDAANENRYEHVLGFTDTEHYAVYRGDDETHPAAEMTVKMTYEKGKGKSYEIVSQTGSNIIQKFGLEPLIENEKQINEPAVVKDSWFASANYEMHLKTGETSEMNGRTCVALAITPKRKAPNMIDGTLWIDPRDGTIAKVEGIGTKSPSPFAGTTQMTRQYTNIDGYSMAEHARAESHNALFGRTVVTIEYTDYQLRADTPEHN
jgi:negative regulator of sigma E activity